MGIPHCNDCADKRNKAFIIIKFLITWEQRALDFKKQVFNQIVNRMYEDTDMRTYSSEDMKEL